MKPRQLTWLLRVVVLVHMILVLAQATFAGQFLAGSASALRRHEFFGTAVLMSVALVHCILAVVCWRRKIQSLAFVAGSVLLYIIEGAQIGFGFNRRLAVHVPLGVLIFGMAALLFFFTLKPKHSVTLEE